MQRLFALIADGGYFYARTPYVVPLTRLMPRLDLTYPGHVHDMGMDFWDKVTDAFDFPGVQIESRPSLVETSFTQAPARTFAAYALKAPARIVRSWPFVGGWEVVLRRENRG